MSAVLSLGITAICAFAPYGPIQVAGSFLSPRTSGLTARLSLGRTCADASPVSKRSPPARARIGERFSTTLCSRPQPASRFPPSPQVNCHLRHIKRRRLLRYSRYVHHRLNRNDAPDAPPHQDSPTKELRPVFFTGVRADHDRDRDQTTYVKVQRRGIASVANVNYGVYLIPSRSAH